MRPSTTYGVHVRHIPAAESDTWATQVRTNRQRLGLTQVVAAKRIGVSREALIRWENGKYLPDNVETVDAAARVLGIDRDLARRLARFTRDDDAGSPEPEMWTYARSLGLDPAEDTVREILDGPWSETTTRHMLREERRWQEEDRQRRLERIRLAKEMYEGGVDQAAG